MRILQVNTSDRGGGAQKVALDLLAAFRRAGHDAWLAVGRRQGSAPGVLEIPDERSAPPWAALFHGLARRLRSVEKRLRGSWRIRYGLEALAGGVPSIRRALGHEDFHFPGSHRLLDLAPERPEIVHLHNLHGRYFDLELLPELSARVPVVTTLHDTWLLSGHCAYTLGCDRWRAGCGHCPDLGIFPAVERDATAYNWRRKQRLYRRSRLYVVTPSRWLMGRVEASMLQPAVAASRVIPNGVDLELFRPSDPAAARARLGLPAGRKILLFAANGGRRNRFKDYATIARAVEEAAARSGDDLLLLLLGEDAPAERLGPAEVRFVPFQTDLRTVALYYQAADVYLHAALPDSENFPTTILESLACGTPVAATAVGGIPEQLDDGVTGHVVPAQDPAGMARALSEILADETRRRQMAERCREVAVARFDLALQVRRHLDWYAEILAERREGSAAKGDGDRTGRAREPTRPQPPAAGSTS